ncbi:MAG: hypothetical protein QF395_07255 [Arenicellales bacterium]|jgi:hypothetical protein|nr:hypothetical protein [Arenicellales bacterium]|tara:strand:- start:399 stop:758 length:360 start_codon:yes stop_codon:yes gene_type:complete
MKKKSSRHQNQIRRCEEDHAKLAAELSRTGFLLQGSITKRWRRCGNPSCSCQQDPKGRHASYYQWTVKRQGKTVTVNLDAEQVAICRQWIQNNRRAENLMRQMRALTLRIAQLHGILLK